MSAQLTLRPFFGNIVEHGSSTRPVMILTIANGAGHIRAAEAIAEAMRAENRSVSALVVNVADYMLPVTRFTHVTAYLWLVKRTPWLWERIDRFQKRQAQTSPDWYYRRGCRRLFELARRLRPRAIVATEVGCCEIAALLKRDLALDAPLVAVNPEYDADCAWVRPEVDLYCAASVGARADLVAHGADPSRVQFWGAPIAREFTAERVREDARAEVCRWLGLDHGLPLVLVAGGSEGLGRVKETAARLLSLPGLALQVIVLTGHNAELRRRCERLTLGDDDLVKRLRVLPWTNRVPLLMRGVDLLVSKLGNTFDEAMAAEVPLIALEPPPGSERVQYRLLNEWNTGRAVRTLDEMADTVASLLTSPHELESMRKSARARRQTDAARYVAAWLEDQIAFTDVKDLGFQELQFEAPV